MSKPYCVLLQRELQNAAVSSSARAQSVCFGLTVQIGMSSRWRPRSRYQMSSLRSSTALKLRCLRVDRPSFRGIFLGSTRFDRNWMKSPSRLTSMARAGLHGLPHRLELATSTSVNRRPGCSIESLPMAFFRVFPATTRSWHLKPMACRI